MNRFFDIDGDVSVQLAPWVLREMGQPLNIAGGVIVVEQGYVSDLASIPQFAWSIFMASDDPRIELGAWVHDLIYGSIGQIKLEDGRRVTLSRKQADNILVYEAMADLLATPAQQFAVYQTLRRLGPAWSNVSFLERFT